MHWCVPSAGCTGDGSWSRPSHFRARKSLHLENVARTQPMAGPPWLRQRYSQIIDDVNEVGMVVQVHSVLQRHRRRGTAGAMK